MLRGNEFESFPVLINSYSGCEVKIVYLPLPVLFSTTLASYLSLIVFYLLPSPSPVTSIPFPITFLSPEYNFFKNIISHFINNHKLTISFRFKVL